jgi:hypothetical protein
MHRLKFANSSRDGWGRPVLPWRSSNPQGRQETETVFETQSLSDVDKLSPLVLWGFQEPRAPAIIGQGSLNQLGGPLAIADQAGRSAHHG